MKLTELETLWQQQPAAPTGDLTREIPRRLDRRSLYLKLMLFSTGVGLLRELEPLSRLLSSRPSDGFRFGAELVKFCCHQALYGALFVFLFRRLRQHGQQVRASAESVGAGLAMSLKVVEGEMGDYRLAAWFALPGTALMLWSAWLNQAVARAGVVAFWPRAAFVLAFVAVVAVVARWHYRARLVPERDRLRAFARDWRGE